MDANLKEKILKRLGEQEGHIGFYFKNMVTGDVLTFNADDRFFAASVIKLPILSCICKWCAEGSASMDEKIKVTDEDKVPSCGALRFFTDEPVVDIRTLCSLMISISDNTATNLLIHHFGIRRYMDEFKAIGLENTELARAMFDDEGAAKGLENKIVPSEIGMLLEKIYRQEFVSREVSDYIKDTLMTQQISHKIRGKIGRSFPVAHKTGEDSGISHDVGIVFANQPFVVCFTSNNTDVYKFEEFIRDTAYDLVESVR